MNDEVLLDNLQFHWLTIVDDGARGGEGEETLEEGGLANFLITHNHDVLDDLGSRFFSHFQGEGGEGGGILREELDMRVNYRRREKW